ncbi:MAG: CRISPR-associated endonuclease Cas3'', partial [Gemmatimonadales bacterium]
RANDTKPIVALRWQGEDSEWVSVDDLRPGDTLIVPADFGGIRNGSFDPESTTPVLDVGDLAALRGRAIAQLRLDPTHLGVWGLPAELIATAPAVDPEETATELRSRIRRWMRMTPEIRPEASLATDAEWAAFRRAFTHSEVRLRVARSLDGAVISARVLLGGGHGQGEVVDGTTEDDDGSFIEHAVTLRQHIDDVCTLVGQFARSLNLPKDIASDLELAAWLHDVGKADERFQRWLVGGSEVEAASLDEPLAKSRFPGASPKERRRAQERAGYPAGYRHELLSLAMVHANREALIKAHDVDLVLHLIASHHGFARPFAPFDDHSDDRAVALDHGVRLTATTRHRLGCLSSDVPARFHRVQQKYGWWGLAWLEAILRLADHRASQMHGEGRAP